MEDVARVPTLEDVYERALACLGAALGVDRAAVLLFDDAGVMRFVASRGLSDAYCAAVEGHSPWGRDEPSPEPVVIADAAAAPDLADFRDLFAREAIGGLTFVPLCFAGELLGKFMLYYRDPRAPSDAELSVARAIAGHIAFAIEHRRLERERSAAHEALERRLEAEHAAREQAESESALRKAIEDSVVAGISAIDEHGVQSYANPAFCEMVGWSHEELVGAAAPFAYWPDDERPAIEEAFRRTLAGDIPPGGFELSFQRRSGERFRALVLPSPLRGSGGGRLGWLASVYDISERKRAEEQLRESESRLRLALDAGGMGTWDWNVATGEVAWSAELERLHGLAPGSFAGTVDAFRADVHPDDDLAVRAAMDDTLAGERDDHTIRYRIQAPGGAHRWMEARGRPIAWRDGRPTRVLGVCSDVTERVHFERGQAFLAEASRILTSSLDVDETVRSMVELAVPRIGDWCIVHLVGDDGQIAPAELLHADPEKVALAWEVTRRWPPPRDASFGVPQAIRTGTSILFERVSAEDLATAAQGPEHLGHLQALGMQSAMIVPLIARGRVIGALTVIAAESGRVYGPEDLTLAEDFAGRAALAIENARLFVDAERARVAAEASAQRVRLLAEATSALVSSLDDESVLVAFAEFAASTMADYCITYAYDGGTAIRRVGIAHRDPGRLEDVVALTRAGPPSLADAQGAGAVIRTGRPVLAATIDAEALATGAQNETHLEVLRALEPWSSMVVPLRARGRTVGAIAFVTTSESKRVYDAEDLLLAEELASRTALLADNARLYREAREAIQARDELVAVVSHDLRNPIQTILTATAVLEGSDRVGARAQRSIFLAARQMDRLLRDLLDIARIEAGGMALALGPVDVEALVDEVVEIYQPWADDRRVVIRREIAPSLARVSGDRDRLLQVLSNLVSNALKFVPRDGSITIRATQEGDVVHLAVIDTGPGIEPTDAPRLFERFYQGSGNGRQGSGLGLAIVKGIVEAHSGRVWVESEPGQGATFTVALGAGQVDQRPKLS